MDGILACWRRKIAGPAETNLPVAMPPNYAKTNGEYVTIGNIMVETNSPIEHGRIQAVHWRRDQLMKVLNSKDIQSTD